MRILLPYSRRLFSPPPWPPRRQLARVSRPDGDGHGDAKNLPVTFGENENVNWKTAIHDKGWSSPVVWGKQIWMTTATEDGTAFAPSASI